MDSLKHALSSPAASQVIGASMLAVCAGLLLGLFLLELVVVRAKRRVTRLVGYTALLSLATSIAAAMTAQRFYETYAFWDSSLMGMLGMHSDQATIEAIANAFTSANQQATILGWSGVAITVALLTAGLVGLRRLVRSGQLPVSPVEEA